MPQPDQQPAHAQARLQRERVDDRQPSHACIMGDHAACLGYGHSPRLVQVTNCVCDCHRVALGVDPDEVQA